MSLLALLQDDKLEQKVSQTDLDNLFFKETCDTLYPTHICTNNKRNKKCEIN